MWYFIIYAVIGLIVFTIICSSVEDIKEDLTVGKMRYGNGWVFAALMISGIGMIIAWPISLSILLYYWFKTKQ